MKEEAQQEVDEDKKSIGATKNEIMDRLAIRKLVRCKDSSEDLACILHLMLTVDILQ